MTHTGRNRMIFQPMSEARWNRLIQLKQEMTDQGPDVCIENAPLDFRIAESWHRCLAGGMPFDKKLALQGGYDRRTVSRAMARNEDLIGAAKSVFDQIYQYLDGQRPFYLELVDRDNVRLLERGIYDESLYYNPIPGEDVLGTSCHALVREYQCPVLISGPENYLEICYNYFTWGVPVFDEIGTCCGGVFLSKRFSGAEWLEINEAEQINNLYFACAIASAVERCWMAKKCADKYEKEKKFRQYLTQLTLDYIDDGVVIVDRDGYILDVNRAALKILDVHDTDRADLGKVTLFNYLADPKKLSLLMQKHQPANFENRIITEKAEKPYNIRYLPLQWTGPGEQAYALFSILEKPSTKPKAKSTIGLRPGYNFNDIVGESPSLKKTMETAKFLALSRENILLIGESGSGKELFAQSIHNARDPESPFIALNCAAFPRSLIESELFGYEQGAFTGAEKDGRPGKIELANGGTLFLDEIGDMPIDIQAILLRVLQDRQVVRIGSVKCRHVDFRVIAATNQNLKQLIEEKKFRQDLYFRLSVLSLPVPPLRERHGDVELLIQFFLKTYCKENDLPVPVMDPQVQALFSANLWPGNVRELENAVKYCVNMSRGNTIRLEHVPEDIHKGTSGFWVDPEPVKSKTALPELTDKDCMPSLKEIEAFYIAKALEATNQNMTRAAAMLGISKTTLYRRINAQRGCL